MIRDIILHCAAVANRIYVPERGTEKTKMRVSFECVFVFLRLELGGDPFGKLGLCDTSRPETHAEGKLLGDNFAAGVFLRKDDFILFNVGDTGVG